jgi:hypothetical protein
MAMASPSELLEVLTNLRAQRVCLQLDDDAERQVLLAPVKDALDQLDTRYRQRAEDIAAQESSILDIIKEQVLNQGISAKGGHLQAIYVAGRVTWDTKKLDGYAAAHQEINSFRKVGEPSITIRELTR